MKLKGSNNNFQPAPEGTTQAVLVDIVDLGMQPDKFNEGESVHQARLSFQTEDKTEEGKPFLVSTFGYKASLNSKSNFYKVVTLILGRKLLKEDFDEEGDVDLDLLILGKNVNITIVHKVVGENTYSNIETISPLIKSQKTLLKSEGYVRVEDRVVVEVEMSGEEEEAVAAFGA